VDSAGLPVYLMCVALICGCISSTSRVDDKVEYVTSKLPELAECNGKTDDLERENCYVDVAVSKSNAVLCDEICSDNLRNLCFYKIAKKVGDINLCGEIRNDDWRYNNCIGSSTL